MAEDADAPALLEWLGSVDSASRLVRSIEELGDGSALLRVMHDLEPDSFPSPEGISGAPRESCLLQLLSGLEEHLRGRGGESDRTCEMLLRQAKAGQPVDAALLTKLVLVATVENDCSRRRFYVEAMMSLSHETQETVQAVLQRFLSGAGLESPTMSSPMNASRPHITGFHTAEFSPTARKDTLDGLEDWREAGVDAETRFRRLQEHYNATLDAQERLLEEKAAMKRDLEAEKARRLQSEQLERRMRLDLREAEEARDRAKEEQRLVFEQLLEAEVGKIRDRLGSKDEELEAMREELDLKRRQAAESEKLRHQLELFKQRVEELQALRHENEELKEQITQILDKGDHAAGDHLHRSLTRTREMASKAAIERDQALRQSDLLREELEREQQALQKAREELLRGGGSAAATCRPPEVVVAPCNGARGGLALEASAAILAAAAGDREGQPADPSRRSNTAAEGPSLEELRLLRTQKDEMMERLMNEKDRATKAETTAQLKSAEVEVLSEQRSSLTKQVAKLEIQLDEVRSRATADATPAGGQQAHFAAETAAEGSEGRIQGLQSKLALREKELQVHQYRGKCENDSLTAQESLMASCFHELGLRYQRLKVDHDRLQRRLRVEPPGG